MRNRSGDASRKRPVSRDLDRALMVRMHVNVVFAAMAVQLPTFTLQLRDNLRPIRLKPRHQVQIYAL